MDSLFGDAVVVTAEDIDKLARPPENFLVWVWSVFVENEGKLVNLLVQAVIKSGQAKTAAEALQYMCDWSSARLNSAKVTHTDLSGRGSQRPFKRLGDLLRPSNEEPVRGGSEIRRLGVISHCAVPEILNGQLPDPEIARCLQRGAEGAIEQLSLFRSSAPQESEQLGIFSGDSGQMGLRYMDCFGADGQLKRGYIRDLRACWQEARQALAGGDDYLRQYTRARRYLAELYELLTPVFGGYVYDLLECHKGTAAPFLDLLTLLSWAGAWHYSLAHGRLYFAREIRLLPPEYGSFGRVDALRVTAVGGQAVSQLSANHRSALAALLSARWPSVGKTLLGLRRAYKEDVQVEIVDWKFSIGDALRSDAIIKPSEVAEKPLPPHLAQMQRYLVLASLDHHLVAQAGDRSHEVWSENGYFQKGALYYWLPAWEEPRIHTVAMTPSEQKEVFKQIVVWRWPKAQRQAIVRTLTNGLVGHLVGLLNHTDHSHSYPAQTDHSSAETFLGVPGLLEEVIVRHRSYFDQNEIIEVVGRNRQGEPFLAMHLDRLFAAVDRGQVAIGQWSERGGFIKCLSPDHQDRNPSMHVSIPAGIFKCFSCGVFGHLVFPADKKTNLPAEARPWMRIRREKKQLRTLVIPPEHDAIMSRAQAFFQSVFWGSAAESYLVRERRLEADLCFALGTGFGSADVLDVLLDEGYSYEQLIQYGFVAISSKISQGRSLWPGLQKRGFAPEEIRRQVGAKEGKPRFGWPYFPLQDRATWPLTLGGKATNFYGRATWPCDRQFTHRKLSVEHTGLPHGAFNFARAELPGDDIYIAEAVIDAITMEMLGYTPVVAVIGANNVAILEAVAVLGKKRIMLAFDADATGQKSVWQATERLRQAGFTGEVVDLSRQFFVVRPPHSDDCKDYNRWLQIAAEDYALFK